MIPRSIFAANLPPTAHLVLILLWDYSGSTEGDPDGVFVWPSLETLQCTLRLGRSALYRAMSTLCTTGYVERASRVVTTREGTSPRRGFVLRMPHMGKPDVADDGTGFLDGPSEPVSEGVTAVAERNTTSASSSPANGAVPIRGLVRPDPWTKPSRSVDSHLYRNHHEPPEEDVVVSPARARVAQTVPPSTKDDDDVRELGALWAEYERHRVSKLGGLPPRIATRTDLRKVAGLCVYCRNRFSASVRTMVEAREMVARYGVEAIRLAREAVANKSPIGPKLVAARSDGREWSSERLDAVMSRVDFRPAAAALPKVLSTWTPPWEADAEPHISGDRAAELASAALQRFTNAADEQPAQETAT